MIFNPLMMVNKEEVRRRVEKLRKEHPDKSNRELCELIIVQKSRLCAVSGAVTALPAALPVIGTLVTLVGGTVLDMTAVGYFTAEMVLEMSAVYGRDLYLPGVSREALWVMASALGSDAASKTISKLAMQQMENQFFTRLARDLLISLGIRASQRTVLKIIPFLGAVISGSVNYFVCRQIGRLAADYYEKNSYENWLGDTIDVEGEIIE
ncbi:hypothetical protein SPSYN_01892 [Sporotomaculum syntrophicum]|uniref:EcsC protein family protein n=1 Tax=Sporotomaculum syntrophicum TaxID=182264 RepID=A0A9D2WRF0_9FIRM|nr:hypothetical protein [Sporotomaculum syntrophicum]KAF1085745.1 hypothetical protein SPSYN_01892 [Sporotomaculum syntrophicum]